MQPKGVTVNSDGKDLNETIGLLHHKARRAIKSGESNLREAAEYLAEAEQLGATQRQSAKAIGKSPAWVNALLKWRRGGYKDQCPFPRSTRRVQAAEQKQKPASRPPTTAQQAKAQIAKATAETAKAEAAKAKHDERRATAEAQRKEAEAAIIMFAPETKRIPSESREALIKTLGMFASENPTERAAAAAEVERQRARLNMTWDELIVPAEVAEAELRTRHEWPQDKKPLGVTPAQRQVCQAAALRSRGHRGGPHGLSGHGVRPAP